MRPPIPLTRSIILSALLLATLGAGCLGLGEADDVAAPEGPPTAPLVLPPEAIDRGNETQTLPQEPLRFPLERPVDLVHWTNGSFATEETGIGGGFFTGAFVKEIDLGHLLPEGVPARVQASVTLDADQVPVVGPTARADPISNGTVWYEGTWRQEAPGHYLLDAVLQRGAGDTFGIALEAYTSGPQDPPEVSYSIRFQVVAHPERVPVGVPVALVLDGNDTVTFETAGTDAAELLIHGPDDRLVDRLYFIGSADWTVPAGRSGEYVVLPIQGAEGVRVHTVVDDAGAPSTLRPLALSRLAGEPHAVPPMDTTTWSFDLDVRPLRVLLHVTGPAGEPWVCSGSLDVEMTAPDGTLMEATTSCPSPTNIPFLYGEGRVWSSGLGDPRLVAGTYEVTVDNTLWYGHHAVHLVETYVR